MLELPEQRLTKKVKILQVFRRPVTSCQQVGSLAVLRHECVPFLCGSPWSRPTFGTCAASSRPVCWRQTWCSTLTSAASAWVCASCIRCSAMQTQGDCVGLDTDCMERGRACAPHVRTQGSALTAASCVRRATAWACAWRAWTRPAWSAAWRARRAACPRSARPWRPWRRSASTAARCRRAGACTSPSATPRRRDAGRACSSQQRRLPETLLSLPMVLTTGSHQTLARRLLPSVRDA